MVAIGGIADIADIGCALRTYKRTRFSVLSKDSFEPLRCSLLNLGAELKRREFITLIVSAYGHACVVIGWTVGDVPIVFMKF
jgi:hypothetical protein